jgi:hypothetical protein
MATFNVSFLNPALKSKGGSGVGVLADQLQILENTLAKDGYLSPGDYDILIAKAREIQMGNSLSSDQRSNYDVKISTYEKLKSTSQLEKADDLKRISDENKNMSYQNNLIFGNNPAEWTRTMLDVYESNINDLQETIDRRRDSGANATEYENELMETMARYREALEMNEAVSNNQDFSNPIPGFAAYVETNNNGEIVNVEYAKYGTKSGYAETNGMINGVQVFGKVNVKRDGKNFFIMGNKIFQAADLLMQDPANPGSFKPTKLVADVETDKTGMRKGKEGYVNLTPEQVTVQSYIPKNSWARGINGTLYKRREDGGYTKYLNATPEDLNIEGSIFNLPEPIESTLMGNADETIDYSAPMQPDQGMNMTPATDLGMSIAPELQNRQTAPQPIKMNYGLENPFQKSEKPQAYRTPQQPSQQVSKGILPTAKRTIQSGINSIKSLFA